MNAAVSPLGDSTASMLKPGTPMAGLACQFDPLSLIRADGPWGSVAPIPLD